MDFSYSIDCSGSLYGDIWCRVTRGVGTKRTCIERDINVPCGKSGPNDRSTVYEGKFHHANTPTNVTRVHKIYFPFIALR